MSVGSRMQTWWRAMTRQAELDAQVSEELRFHIESHAEELSRRGMPREEAMRRARAELGNTAAVRENARQAWGTRWFDECRGDLRFALRMLIKSPGFALIAIGSLVLGIGADTAMFSVVHAILLRPLPFPQSQELVAVTESSIQQGIQTGASYADFAAWRAQNRDFRDMAGYQFHELTLTGQGEPTVLNTVVTTPSLFPLLDAAPLAGRTFSEQDGVRGAAAVAIVSEQLWRSQLGGDPHLVGRPITLDHKPFTVIGIMPADFHYPLNESKQDVWIPLAQDPLFGPWMSRPGGHWLRVVARLRDGVTMAQGRAEIANLEARRAKEDPADDAGWTASLTPLQAMAVGGVRLPLLVTLGAVVLVLLIACANIANLLLARATARTKEMAVRVALGADRRRIVRQLLTESAILGLFGGGLGTALAWLAVRSFRAALADNLPQIRPVTVDGTVLAFALALSLAAGVVFGLAPALLATRTDPQRDLAEGARAGAAQGPQRIRRILAATQIALAMVLLTGAGLLMRSFLSLTSVHPGFSTNNVVKAGVSLPQFEYSTPQQWAAFSDELLRRLDAQPGFEHAAIVAPLPILDGFVNLGFTIVGAPPLPPGATQTAEYVAASPDYFRLMEIPLLQGRALSNEDRSGRPDVTLISAEFARRYFPHRNPLGQYVTIGLPPKGGVPRQIVGIVGDVRDASLSEAPGPMLYVPFSQSPFWGGEVVVRSRLGLSAVAQTIRDQVRSIDRGLPVTDVESLSTAIDDSVADQRLRTQILTAFGAVALLLAAGGIFGVVSYSVSQRTTEIGIRMALGAERGRVLSMVLREAWFLAVAGVVAGLAGTLALGRFVDKLLYGVKAHDPETLFTAAALLMLSALAASWIPARRAAGIDPVRALRHD